LLRNPGPEEGEEGTPSMIGRDVAFLPTTLASKGKKNGRWESLYEKKGKRGRGAVVSFTEP